MRLPPATAPVVPCTTHPSSCVPPQQPPSAGLSPTLALMPRPVYYLACATPPMAPLAPLSNVNQYSASRAGYGGERKGGRCFTEQMKYSADIFVSLNECCAGASALLPAAGWWGVGRATRLVGARWPAVMAADCRRPGPLALVFKCALIVKLGAACRRQAGNWAGSRYW